MQERPDESLLRLRSVAALRTIMILVAGAALPVHKENSLVPALIESLQHPLLTYDLVAQEIGLRWTLNASTTFASGSLCARWPRIRPTSLERRYAASGVPRSSSSAYSRPNRASGKSTAAPSATVSSFLLRSLHKSIFRTDAAAPRHRPVEHFTGCHPSSARNEIHR